MLLLVPCDPLKPRRPDPHFSPESEAAREADVTVALIDHDALTAGDVQAAVSRVPADSDAVYRGWMMSTGEYRSFEQELATRGCRLRTTGDSYARCHEFPGWFPQVANFSPASRWTTGDSREQFDHEREQLNASALVLRDYVKSMKHYWSEAAFVPDGRDSGLAWRIASELRRLREDSFAGGFVLREFEHFTEAEVRTWWVDGVCVHVGAHPDTPDAVPDPAMDLSFLAAAVAQIGSPFCAADLALRDDGKWRIIEIGDGQVSDRPESTPPELLIGLLDNRH